MTLQEALATAQALPLDRLDAQRLLLHVLATTASDLPSHPLKDSLDGSLEGSLEDSQHRRGHDPRGRAWLLAHDDELLTPAAQRRFETLTARRAAGEPLAYLTGYQSFYGLELAVNPAVLIPRPDTETLVDWALALPWPAVTPLQVLDLGTGSGAIALALKHHRSHWHLTATDASAAALAVAKTNALRLGLPLGLVQSDWFRALGVPGAIGASEASRVSGALGVPGASEVPVAQADHHTSPRFHLIVSNPPYIVEGDAHLPALRHEPTSALTSGPDGLADLRQIIAQSSGHLHPGGWLLVEHGYDQASAVRALLELAGFADVQSRCDLNGIERCSGGQLR